MAICPWPRLPRNLVSLLTMLCLLHAISAEAKQDTEQAYSADVAELQTKAAHGFVKQELELAADYFAGRGVPKDLSQAVYWYRKARQQIREIPQRNSTLAMCTPPV
jgi:TPR repeat protein